MQHFANTWLQLSEESNARDIIMSQSKGLDLSKNEAVTPVFYEGFSENLRQINWQWEPNFLTAQMMAGF